MTTPRQAAEEIIGNVRMSFSAPHLIVRAEASQFRHLDLAAYDTFQRALEQQGFGHLADIELLDMTTAPGSLFARTMVRTMVSADGHIISSYYQLKPRRGRVALRFLNGVLNARPIVAAAFCWRASQTRHCNDFETELSDDRYLVTSTTEMAASFSLPPSIATEYFPYGTSPETLLARHRHRMDAVRQTGAFPLAIGSLEQLQQMQNRLKAAKDAYRESVQWVTRAELHRLARGQSERADAVFLEVQKLLAEEKGVRAEG